MCLGSGNILVKMALFRSGERRRVPLDPFRGHLWINLANYLINWACPVLYYYPECTDGNGQFFILIGMAANLGRAYTFCIRGEVYFHEK